MSQDELNYFLGSHFFHDGEMQSLSFSDDMQRISMRISCPNIKIGENYIQPVWFTCLFKGLVSFEMLASKVDEYNDPLSRKERRVLIDEIQIIRNDDKIEAYREMYQTEFVAIEISTIPANRNLKFLFEEMEIIPDEPLAFEMWRKMN